MAGLLDNLANAPQETGVGNALMAAAAALLTPSIRGGGLGSAFAAMPQAIQQAQMQSMQNRLFGLKEQQLGFEMNQARTKQEQEQTKRDQFAGLVQTLPPEQRGLAMALGNDYFKNMAPQAPKLETFFDDQGRERKGWTSGPGSEPQYVGGAKSGAQSNLAQLLAEREKYPVGSPQRQFYDAALSKSTTHAPAASTNVYTGTMVPGEVDGKPVFVMPAKDGTVKPVTGIEPPGSAAARDKSDSESTTARDYINLIDLALAHPGRKTSTGMSGVLDPSNYIPGSAARSYKAIHKQLEGKAFLAAFSGLKGGGPVTDVEGKKATEASVRLDTAQSDEAYEQALLEARQMLAERYEKSTGRSFGAGGNKPSSGFSIRRVK